MPAGPISYGVDQGIGKRGERSSDTEHPQDSWTNDNGNERGSHRGNRKSRDVLDDRAIQKSKRDDERPDSMRIHGLECCLAQCGIHLTRTSSATAGGSELCCGV